MRLSALVGVVAGALTAAIIAPVYGTHPGLVTGALVAGVSGIGLGIAHWAATRHTRWTLSNRFAVAVAVAVGVILATVVATAELMFVSNHDALMIAAIVVAAALVALRGAQVASAGVVREVRSIRDALLAVGAGERGQRVDASAAAELEDLAEATNAMIAQLAEEESRRDSADSARRNLVAAISHDLRTPLAALAVMVDAIEDGLADEATRERYLANMRTHVGALGSMIDDLFELSRLEAGDLHWSIRQVELSDLVGETVAAMQVEAAAKGIAVATELSPQARRAKADPEKLQRVLFNLIQNAIRHTPADGSVTVRAEPAGEWIEIEVADTGEGIPAQESERVFDPFVRGEAARSPGRSGLGLAISRAIVEAHNGRIWVAESDVGTRVRFVIPA